MGRPKKQEIAEPLTFAMPGWMSYWSVETLQARRDEIAPRAFEQGYRQKPYSSDEQLFPNFAPRRNYQYGTDWRAISAKFLNVEGVADPFVSFGEPNPEYDPGSLFFVDLEWPRFIGVDLSRRTRAGNVIFVLALDYRTDVIHTLDILSGEWTSPETAMNLSQAIVDYDPDWAYVESNNLQTAIVEWMQTSQLPGWTKLETFETGRQKMDPDIGLPSLDVRFAQGLFRMAIPHLRDEIPEPDPRDPTKCKCTRCRFVRDVKNTTREDDTPDTVMACWIGKEASRVGLRFQSPIRVITAKQLDIKRTASGRFVNPISRVQFSPAKAAMGASNSGVEKNFGRVVETTSEDQKRRRDRNSINAAKLIEVINNLREGLPIPWAELTEPEAAELDRMLEEKASIYAQQDKPEQAQFFETAKRQYRSELLVEVQTNS